MFSISPSPPITFVGTLTAILVAHVFYNTTIVIRLVGNSWAQLDPRLAHAARVLGADSTSVLREITLPLLRPSLMAAILLVFLFDFTSFGVVLLLGGWAIPDPRSGNFYSGDTLPQSASGSIAFHDPAAVHTLLLHHLQPGGDKSHRAHQPSCRFSQLSGRRDPCARSFLLSAATIFILILFALPMAALPARSVVRLEPDRGERGEFQPALL